MKFGLKLRQLFFQFNILRLQRVIAIRIQRIRKNDQKTRIQHPNPSPKIGRISHHSHSFPHRVRGTATRESSSRNETGRYVYKRGGIYAAAGGARVRADAESNEAKPNQESVLDIERPISRGSR